MKKQVKSSSEIELTQNVAVSQRDKHVRKSYESVAGLVGLLDRKFIKVWGLFWLENHNGPRGRFWGVFVNESR